MAPELTSGEFEDRLGDPWTARPGLRERLYAHYLELVRWNRRLSLIAGDDLPVVVERHYRDSLEALSLVPERVVRALDIGSGAGFPGLVLAAALPDVEFTLVESRQRKWAFLRTAARRCAPGTRCVHGTLGHSVPEELPQRIDLVTIRALQLPMPAWEALIPRLSPAGRVLVWAGERAPELPAGLRQVGERASPGAAKRRILAYGAPD